VQRLLICSVGTSLLTGRNRPWKWSPDAQLPDLGVVEAWLKDADPVEASAETNTLSRLEIGKSDRICFLHSDTPEGKYCAERLAAHYAEMVRSVSLKGITQLGYGAKGFSRGLKSLIDIVCQLIHEAHRQGAHEQAILCATGGFKAEIAYLNLLGALLQVEVVYIHELHRELVILPRLPLTWDTDFAMRNRAFFEWIEAEPRNAVEVESWLKQEPLLRELVEPGDDGCLYLSPAGLLLYRAAQERTGAAPSVLWPPDSPMLPEKKLTFENAPHKRPRGWEHYINRLCAIPCVTQVGYAETMHTGERVQILDAERGEIGVRFGVPGDSLPIRVKTTACGLEQTRLVAEYIRKLKHT
jgi:putative CRISPR-associated protein (TIGR02619 family)